MRIYKCPSCGSNMVFDSETQQLTCAHCQTSVPVDQADSLHYEEQSAEDETERSQEETGKREKFKMYHCPSCGAEILTDKYTVATFCAFCQSPTLVEDALTAEQAPQQLVPFAQSRQQAMDAYRAWTKKGLLTPSEFTKTSTIEKITGIYVPFWLFDYHTDTSLNVEATRVRTEVRGDTRYTHTDYFQVYRDVEADFEKIPTDASSKMEDEIMDKLEPFHYGDLKPFDMAYLSGFYAERYNFTSEQMKPRVEERIRQYSTEGAMETIQGYATKRIIHESCQMHETRAEYVMLPVWTLNYRYKGKNYNFSMNGQTGRIVGTLPVSYGKMAGWFGGVLVGVFLFLHLLMMIID